MTIFENVTNFFSKLFHKKTDKATDYSEWFVEGKNYRDEGPAIINQDGPIVHEEYWVPNAHRD